MHTVLDCRGLACPQPVIRAKELLDTMVRGSLEVLVDNEAAQSNLTRFGKNQGYGVESRASGDTRHITISKDTFAKDTGAAPAPEEYNCDLPATGLVMVIPSETMGRGDDALGSVLMRAYVKTIKNLNPLPGKIFFYNSGVKITATESDLIAPLHLADRDRNTLRVTANWMPIDPLSFNLRADISRDEYTGREIVPFGLGPREGTGQNYAVDAAYVFTDAVLGSVWAQRNVNSYENALCQSAAVPNANTCTASVGTPVWSADLRNFADTFGLGLRAKLTEKLELVADAMRSRVRDEMRLTSITPAPSVVDTGSPLPDIHTTVTTLKLSARYALWRNAGVSVMYIYDRYETDDWTWANWNYTPAEGGTTVRQEPLQKVHFIGVSGHYRWW